MSEFFRKFHLKTELDTTEILKWIFAVFGAVIVFCSITTKLKDLQVKQVQLELAKEFPNLIPSLKNNYTNQLSKEGQQAIVLVVLRNKSKLPVEVKIPELYLYSPNGTSLESDYTTSSDINQFHGILSPSSEYRITYTLNFKKPITTAGHQIQLIYKASLPKSLIEVYQEVFTDIPDSDWGNVTNSWNVEYKYKEQLYLNGKNSIWPDWWKNPR